MRPRLAPRPDRPDGDLAHANRALRMLSASNAAMLRAQDESQLLEDVCRIVVDIGGYRLAGVGYAQDDAEKSLRPMAAAGDKPENVLRMRLSWDAKSPWGQGPAGQCVRTGLAIAYPDLRDQAQGFPWRDAALANGYEGAITLPLREGARCFGFIGLFSGQGRLLHDGELALLRDLADNVSFGIGALRAASERRRIAAELAWNAAHEPVTGLERYSVLQQRLAPVVADGTRSTAMLLLGLDRFQAVNESMGHAQADRVLGAVAQRLLACAAQEPSLDVAHFAGDEFVLASPDTGAEAALALAERLRDCVAAPIECEGFRLLLTCTIGISLSPPHGTDCTELLRHAQAALQLGKERGRDCCCLFRTEQMQDIEDRMVLGGRLRGAAAAGALRLHYQPQFRAADGRACGFEALLRWQDAELGPVPPGRFIPVAEALGLMPEIGEWVLREACRQAREWLDAGHHGFRIAVNVSAQQLQRPGLVRAVAAALAQHALPAALLDLEITESSLMENVARLHDTLGELKALGVSLSLDDFGTGYSSLSYLKHFPIDKLKIDQGFVRELPGNADDAAIARTIVTIGHQLRMQVSAEGVETAAQAEFLRLLGCDELQGYLFGRPEPAELASRHLAG